MFAHLMVNIWDKFNRKVTYSGVKYKYDSDQRKELPCLTLCPENGLKKKGSFYSQKEIDENSYNLTEIFDPRTWEEDKGFFENSITFQDNLLLGRCFTICNTLEWDKRNGPSVYLKRDIDVKVFIHKGGDDFWLNGASNIPPTIVALNIEVNNQKGMAGASISLVEIEMTHLSKPEDPCMHYSLDGSSETNGFLKCCKDKMWEKFGSNFSCSIAAMANLIPKNVTIKECSNQTQAEEIFWIFYNIFGDLVDDPNGMSCPNSCQQTRFKPVLNYLHKNVIYHLLSDYKDNLFVLTFFFESLIVEQRIESLEYDIWSFLSAAGGNLSLMLGFSVLSLIFAFLDSFKILKNIW